jgi:RNA polymerase sigma-70 factor, ECF subfamily
LAYQAGVLEATNLKNSPTGPCMVFMPGGGSAGRGGTRGTPDGIEGMPDAGVAILPALAGAVPEGVLVGTEADGTGGSAVPGTATTETGTTKIASSADELFRSNYPKLAGWIRRLVDDDDTAHEIASEAFVRLLGRWTKVDNPQSYLYMIATNLVRDHWRKTERERRAMRAVTASAASDHAPSPAQDVDVRQLIQGLPVRLRNAFLLHYYAGFAVREVAVMLGRPEGTVKADLFAARAKLRASLGGAGRD